jgi:hypothetical protein
MPTYKAFMRAFGFDRCCLTEAQAEPEMNDKAIDIFIQSLLTPFLALIRERMARPCTATCARRAPRLLTGAFFWFGSPFPCPDIQSCEPHFLRSQVRRCQVQGPEIFTRPVV